MLLALLEALSGLPPAAAALLLPLGAFSAAAACAWGTALRGDGASGAAEAGGEVGLVPTRGLLGLRRGR